MIPGKVNKKVENERIHLKQVEQFNQKLSMAIEQSPLHIVITDTNGKIEYVNSRFSEVTGYSTDEIIRLNPKVLKSGFHTLEFYQNIWNTIEIGNVWRGEFFNKKKDGTLFWESSSISPLKNAERIITHYISVKEDITLRKKMEQEIIEARDKAERSDKLKTSFLHNMSHEIRTPLNAISGFTSLLNEQEMSNETRSEYIEIIQKSSAQLISIVEDILTLSRIETHQETITETQVFLNGLLKDIFSEFNPKSLEKNIKLTFHENESYATTRLLTDEIKLRQILSNLINNAIKFTSEGSVSIGFIPKDGFVEFFVSDTGIGIKKEMHSLIFERFAQVELNMSRTYGGNGLGLSISKDFVQLLGGDIWLESDYGKGSVFYFTIPIKPRKELDISSFIYQDETENTQKNILIVEDEEFNFYLIKQLLSKQNYKLFHAINGKVAIECCLEHKDIGLVLMDIKMPEMDGKTALVEIRKFRPNLPIVAQTAYALEHDKEIMLSQGFDDILTKPFKREDLMQVILKNIQKNSF
jgi:hypothetical protein